VGFALALIFTVSVIGDAATAGTIRRRLGIYMPGTADQPDNSVWGDLVDAP
jgi:hypothetical protein